MPHPKISRWMLWIWMSSFQKFLISKEGAEKLVPVLEAVCGEYVPNLKKTSQEITSVMRGLEGQYIEPGPGGAPTGGRADVLPTGRNFYGIDERMLPTKTAYEVGRTLADQVIEAFIKEEGDIRNRSASYSGREAIQEATGSAQASS